jgi:hypothetical protein
MHVGLWMNDGQRVMFDFNPVRLEVAGKLMDVGELRVVRAVLQEMKSALSPRKQTNNHHLADEWDGSTMSYLQRYATNLLVVEPTVPVALELNPENFQKMCERYLGMHSETPRSDRSDLEHRARRFFSKELKQRTDLNAKLDSQELNGLLFPVVVPSLGLNEAPFVCEVLDFDRRIDVITQKIGEVLNLQNAFISNNYKQANFFAIGNEPAKKDRKTHQVWSDLRKYPHIQLVPEIEQERIAEFVIEHDVRPWFEVVTKK